MTTLMTEGRTGTRASVAQPVHNSGTIGFFVVTGRRVSGWVWDPTRPQLRLDVEIRCDGRTVAIMKAENLREDLRVVGMGDGCYGFALALDEAVSDDEVQRVDVLARERPGSSEVQLVNRSLKSPLRSIPANAGMPPWIAELAQLCREIEQVSTRLAQVGPPPECIKAAKSAADFEATLRHFEARMGRIDTLQLSVDRLLAHFTNGGNPAVTPQGIAGLRQAVAAVGLLSLVSLAIGLRDVFWPSLFTALPW